MVQGYGGVVSPVTYLQNANYANSAAPASATLSNTAAGYTTKDGQFQFALLAAAETDYALFGWTCPAPYTFMVTGVRISELWVQSLVVGFTAPLVIQWGLGVNSSAVSLATAAPYPSMRVALGAHVLGGTAVATAGQLIGSAINWTPGTPIPVLPGRFMHVICKIPLLGAAGTACIVRGTCVVDGYFD